MFQSRRAVLTFARNTSVLHVVRYHLSRAGFEVATAHTLDEAVQRLRASQPDVVISEYGPNETEGCNLRKRVFLDPGVRTIPFLFLVDSPREIGQPGFVICGRDEYMPKPLEPMGLIARVQAMVTRRAALEEMTRIDPLTNLLNRTTVEHETVADLCRLLRYGRNASLALVDMDGLRSVNEALGEAAGDLLLATFASLAHRSMRASDRLGRYRGQQFLFYLPETSAAGAAAFLDRLLTRFESLSEQAVGRRATFSAGLVEAPQDGENLDTLLPRLLRALYNAKEEEEQAAILPYSACAETARAEQ